MSAKKRADLLVKLHKVVKKEYSVITPPSNRTVLEHMIYGAVLEDSTFEAADEAFAKLQENFYDWNEVRVTTRRELAELMKSVSEPAEAAARVKRSLHGVFEKYYQFDLEFLKKENLSKAIIAMESFTGMSAFTIAYTAQNGLSGHSIPIDQSFMNLMYAIGAIGESELRDRKITGLERTIPKAKGEEFSILVHQLAVAYTSSPFSSNVRNVILKVASDAKDRFPKRGGKKPAQAEEKPKATKKVAKSAAKAPAPAAKKATAPATKKATASAAKKATKKVAKSTKAKAAASKKAKAKSSAKPKKKVAKTTAKKASKKLSKKKPR
jgi:endonuclease-3